MKKSLIAFLVILIMGLVVFLFLPFLQKPSLGSPFKIKVGESVLIESEDLEIAFLEVSEDSRIKAERGVNYLWSGRAIVLLQASSQGDKIDTLSLATDNSIGGIGKYSIKLQSLTHEHVATLIVSTIEQEINSCYAVIEEGRCIGDECIERCLSKQSIRYNYLNLCKSLSENKYSYQACMHSIGINTNNPELCSESNYADACYSTIGVSLGDSQLCEKVKDDKEKARCYFYVAQKQKNPRLCDKVGDHMNKEVCYINAKSI